MRAVARACTSFALLALVAVGFSATIRVCGPTDARARELQRDAGGAPLVTAVLSASELVTDDGLPGGPTGRPTEHERHVTSDRAATNAERGSADADTGGGGLEMHHLSVWDSAAGSPYVYLSFTPVSLESFAGEVRFRRTVVEGEEVEVADVAPTLDEAHIRIQLDSKPVDVASLQWYYAGYGDLGGADVKYMPVCLIRVERPDLSAGEHDVHVRIEDVDTGATGDGSATLTCGARVREL
ncbi:MAG: hypothetical protein ABIE42_04725 [Candidatus Eisenbacteria bacterium]